MTETNAYKVVSVREVVYLDKNHEVVSGYEMTVYITEFDETRRFTMPSTDPKAAKKTINDYIKDRQALAALTD